MDTQCISGWVAQQRNARLLPTAKITRKWTAITAKRSRAANLLKKVLTIRAHVIRVRCLVWREVGSECAQRKHYRGIYINTHVRLETCKKYNGGCHNKRKCTDTAAGPTCGDCAAGWTNDGPKNCKGLFRLRVYCGEELSILVILVMARGF